MAIAPELLAGGAEAGGEGESAVSASGKMPRQPAYLTRQQAGQYNSDNAEYQDMKAREAGHKRPPVARPVRRRSASVASAPRRSSGGGRSSGGLNLGGGISKAGKPGMITKLIYATFAGLVVLELASLVTGTPFSLHIPTGIKPGAKKGTYLPLYSSQPANSQTSQTPPPPNQTTDQNPGLFGGNFSPGPLTQAIIDTTGSSTTAGGTSVGSSPQQGFNTTLYPTPQSVSGFQIPGPVGLGQGFVTNLKHALHLPF